VSWETFLALLEEMGPDRGRLAYAGGLLEVTSPSGTHERLKGLIGRFIETLSLLLDFEISSFGSTTLLQELAQRGIEPDECYYIQSEASVRGKGDIDMKHDPPPDLAVEVELGRSSIDKLEIYRSLGVPEVWRYSKARLTVHLLGPDGSYSQSARSAAFPFLPMEGVEAFLLRWDTAGETQLVREFGTWAKSLPRQS
jgi:Uma2 family endonuclease